MKKEDPLSRIVKLKQLKEDIIKYSKFSSELTFQPKKDKAAKAMIMLIVPGRKTRMDEITEIVEKYSRTCRPDGYVSWYIETQQDISETKDNVFALYFY